ncbi:hypothetical protein G6F51_014433 [Rhizopus arrhizus]|uniref:Uncharacterized protein n=1 Tax=Rhizopus oryzae TaxID=64495 RepID=A0A9P6XMI2_RHIOR|nr:hypothetical protein G6F51_014433 [Rhizopus arrhizus]
MLNLRGPSRACRASCTTLSSCSAAWPRWKRRAPSRADSGSCGKATLSKNRTMRCSAGASASASTRQPMPSSANRQATKSISDWRY